MMHDKTIEQFHHASKNWMSFEFSKFSQGHQKDDRSDKLFKMKKTSSALHISENFINSKTPTKH